jgi:hypothetical protein
MSKGNTKAQNLTGTISTESILITVESNWIQMLSLARIIHDGSSRNGGVARDKREERLA